MAKKTTAEVPVESKAQQVIEPQVAEVGAVTWIEIRLPLCAPPEGTYIASQIGHINAALNRHQELPGFRELHAGLRSINALMSDGKPVASASDVLRWFTQQLTQAQAQNPSTATAV